MAIKSFPVVFRVGDDVSQEELAEWTTRLTFWVTGKQRKEPDPRAKAEQIMKAALYGTKLNGEVWLNVETISLPRRIAQLSGGCDVLDGKGGVDKAKRGRPKRLKKVIEKGKENAKHNDKILDSLEGENILRQREEFKRTLVDQFPHLSNPVYASKVNALAESEVKLMALSDTFLTATGKALETNLKIQEGLRKSINELMEMLSIHPKQLVSKVDENERGDVGTLMVKWDDYGRLAQTYEQVDAIQELIQTIRKYHNVRLDGSPQLADYMLWHNTGCMGHNYTCPQCKTTVELFNGFTIEQLEEAAEQAAQVWGYGLKRIENGSRETAQTSG